jgi:hypothetical protein
MGLARLFKNGGYEQKKGTMSQQEMRDFESKSRAKLKASKDKNRLLTPKEQAKRSEYLASFLGTSYLTPINKGTGN